MGRPLCQHPGEVNSAPGRLLSGILNLKRNMAKNCAKSLVYKHIFAAYRSGVPVKKKKNGPQNMLSFQLFACFDLTSSLEIFKANWHSTRSVGLGKEIEWCMFSMTIKKL